MTVSKPTRGTPTFKVYECATPWVANLCSGGAGTQVGGTLASNYDHHHHRLRRPGRVGLLYLQVEPTRVSASTTVTISHAGDRPHPGARRGQIDQLGRRVTGLRARAAAVRSGVRSGGGQVGGQPEHVPPSPTQSASDPRLTSDGLRPAQELLPFAPAEPAAGRWARLGQGGGEERVGLGQLGPERRSRVQSRIAAVEQELLLALPDLVAQRLEDGAVVVESDAQTARPPGSRPAARPGGSSRRRPAPCRRSG